MLDKLHLKTSYEISIDMVEKRFPGHVCVQIPDINFKRCLAIKINNKHLMTIKTNPRWGHVSASHVQLNPKNWENFSHLKDDLESITNLEELELCRIDHAVDVPIPIEQIHQGIRVRYKQDTKIFYEEEYKRASLTGFYIGKGPEVFCIYDKAYQLEGKKLKLNQDQILNVSTRIEVRHFKKKITHSSFLELPQYLNFRPFENVEYFELNSSSPNMTKQEKLEDLMQSDGLGRLYASLNKQHNFKRNFRDYLTSKPLGNTLNEIYRENLSHFFQGEINENA